MTFAQIMLTYSQHSLATTMHNIMHSGSLSYLVRKDRTLGKYGHLMGRIGTYEKQCKPCSEEASYLSFVYELPFSEFLLHKGI